MADLEGDGVEETLPRPSRGSGTTYSFAGDVDGDGAEDVMIAGWGWRVVSGPTVEAVYRSGLHELDALATLTADGWVQPAGDLDGDGLDDLLGQSSCAGTCARSLVWLGRDLSRGLGDPSTTLEGFLQPIGDVNDDGLDDAVLRDASLRIHLGDPLAGLEVTAAISVADMGGVMRGGVLVDAARTTATTLAIGRITTSGVQPFGEPLGVLSTRGATWLDLRDELPLLLLPDGDAEGSLLVRLARDGSRRQLVLPVTFSPSRGGGPASMW